MTFVSYASNGEDVVLWRALKSVDHGTYVDWSDEAADAPSITRAFYDRGWSGVLVRPEALVDALSVARPRDRVTTAALWQLQDGPVQLLRIKLNGDSSAALHRIDLAQLRPWLVVVPAQDASCGAILREAGYVQAQHDGLNHIYVSREQTELASLVAADSDTRDDTVLASHSQLAERLAATQLALAAAEMRVAASSERLVDAVVFAGTMRDDIRRKNEESVWLRSLVDHANAAESASRADAAWLRGVFNAAQQQLLSREQEVTRLRGLLDETAARAESQARQLALWHVSTKVIALAALRWLKYRVQSRPAAPLVASPVVADPVSIRFAEPETLEAAVSPAPLRKASEPDAEPASSATPTSLAVPAHPPMRAVHQFHAGSGLGDAITNSMRLIRSKLRQAGFQSEIFVEHRGGGLGEDIRMLDSIPEHNDYVLLFHYSMGFQSFEQVLALSARKILIYHNITPADLLCDMPDIQQQAQIGRENLLKLRGHVVSALADSAFNTLELRQHGFQAVVTCPLLFDIAAMMQRAARPPALSHGLFTVLFVGRVTRSKAQDALVDAFALFKQRLGRPCRLVLVGRLDVDDHKFIAVVQQKVTAAGVQADVHLTGSISDRELHDWYGLADLYVSLSQHEGFGVPLVEAMAYGIPVVAWPAAAVPFTLGGAGLLLASREPAAVADAMLEAARDRSALAGQGYRSIRRWSLEQHLPALMETLAFAGAPPPRYEPGRDALQANMHVAIVGHVAKTYSLAAVNRGLAKALYAQRPGTVRIVPVEGTVTADLREVPEADRPLVAKLAMRDRPSTGPELVLSGHYPVYVPEERGDLLAAVFFWEESLIQAETVAILNTSFDAVFAPSQAVAKAVVDSGVAKPVLNLGQVPDLSRFAELSVKRHPGEHERSRLFSLLHISSAFPRKGLDVLLAAWVRAFTASDNVKLVIKTFPNPHNDAAEQVDRLRAAHPNAASIELLDQDISEDAMLELYREAGALVLPSRGEGYNLPAAEAAAAGVPVIVTGHGGHLDFCTAKTARLIKRRFVQSTSHLATPLSLWAEPDLDDLVAALHEAAAGKLARLVEPARRAILQLTDPAAFTSRLMQAASRLLLTDPAVPIRLSWVSSWGVRCGIAEYSRSLLDALPRDQLGDIVVFADNRTVPDGNVRAGWQLGDASSVDRLIAGLAKRDADITMIQHQPGLLPWPWLGRVVDSLADDGRVTMVTLHNTSHLLDIPAPERDAAVHALGRAARVLVHTLADLVRLDELGLAHVTTLLPHPASPAACATVRPLGEAAAPVIGCTGFFLPGKGIAELIVATARLRSIWPEVRLRLVNAEYGDPLSAHEIALCRELAAAEGLAVEWHTEFVSLSQQQALLRGCDLVVLPYQQSKESSSAALRSALATGIPVAVTPLALFEEARGAVHELPGMSPELIADGMASLLRDVDAREALVASAREWLAARALPDVARRLHGMMLGLVAQARFGQPLDGSMWQRAG